MKILVSGYSGFVGSNLIPYLKRKGYAEAIGLNLRSDWEEEVENQADVIIHLAGKAHDLKKTSEADSYYQINLELTKKFYNAFLKSDAKKFIFISSVKAAADSLNGVLTEHIDANPQTHYGKSKLMAEAYIVNQPLPVGKNYYILRPSMIHGPGNKGNLNLLYKFVKMGIPYPLAAYQNRRSFLSIENLCFVLSQLIEKAVPSGIYNVADDDALSTNEVVSILAKSLSKNARLWSVQAKFVELIARVGDHLKLPLNSERLEKLTEDYIVDNRKLKQELNITLPLTAREGLFLTAKSFR